MEGVLLKRMSFQEEETSYQNQICQEKFDRQRLSQGLDSDVSNLLTKVIVPGEVKATEAEHSATVTTITADATIIKPAIIINRKYVYTIDQRNNNKRKAEIGPE